MNKVSTILFLVVVLFVQSNAQAESSGTIKKFSTDDTKVPQGEYGVLHWVIDGGEVCRLNFPQGNSVTIKGVGKLEVGPINGNPRFTLICPTGDEKSIVFTVK